MSTLENKDVAHRFMDEIVNGQRLEQADELLAQEYTLYFPGQPALDRNEMPKFLAEIHAGFPDFYVLIEDMIAEGDSVAMLLTMSGTHNGVFQGMPPTGKRMEVHGQVFFRLKDGKILEDRPVFDRVALLEQLGVMQPGRAV